MARPRGAQARADAVRAELADLYPDVQCALVHRNAYELLGATILSAQCTDERVNMVTPVLFDRYPTPGDLAHADPDELEGIIKSTGFYRAKAKSLLGMAAALEDRFGGEVPTDLDDLVTIPGVGRKTGNVVRSVAFDLPGLPVDTHVGRLSRRLRLTNQTDPVKAELELNDMVPPAERGRFSLRLIEHGRRVCDARKPRCDECTLASVCPSAGVAVAPKAAKAKAAKRATPATAKPVTAKAATATAATKSTKATTIPTTAKAKAAASATPAKAKVAKASRARRARPETT